MVFTFKDILIVCSGGIFKNFNNSNAHPSTLITITLIIESHSNFKLELTIVIITRNGFISYRLEIIKTE